MADKATEVLPIVKTTWTRGDSRAVDRVACQRASQIDKGRPVQELTSGTSGDRGAVEKVPGGLDNPPYMPQVL